MPLITHFGALMGIRKGAATVTEIVIVADGPSSKLRTAKESISRFSVFAAVGTHSAYRFRIWWEFCFLLRTFLLRTFLCEASNGGLSAGTHFSFLRTIFAYLRTVFLALFLILNYLVADFRTELNRYFLYGGRKAPCACT